MTILAPTGDLTNPRDGLWGEPGWPEWIESFRSHQITAMVDIMEKFNSGVDVVLLDAPTGCLAGDTEILVNRGGASRRYPISHLVNKFNGGGTGGRGQKRWDLRIPTKVQRALVVPKYGSAIRLALLERAVESGVKQTYLLRTDHGQSIRATADHRFALDGGHMVPLSDIEIGDHLLVDAGPDNRRRGYQKPKPWYHTAGGLVNHPLRGAWPYRQPVHRLVVEADKNGLPLNWYLAILRDKNADVSNLWFLEAHHAVHHLNEDPRDNRRENLEVLTHVTHGRHHGLEGGWAHVVGRVQAARVVSIESYGEEPTYDLTVADDPHNFIANGFVVHNSGKSLLGEATRRLLNTKGIYVATTKSLQQQMVETFPYAKLLKGRANYSTHDRPDLFKVSDSRFRLTAADCTKKKELLPACGSCPDKITMDETPQYHCSHCHDWWKCPYERAKSEALDADLTVMNTAYFLTECNGPGRFSKQSFVVLDEADCLESTILGQVTTEISTKWRKRLGITAPKVKGKDAKSNDWMDWVLSQALPRVNSALYATETELAIFTNKPPTARASFRPTKFLPAAGNEIELRREQKHLQALSERLVDLETQLSAGNAIYDGYDRDEIIFKPIRVGSYGKDRVWRHGQKWLLMSATLIDPQEFVESVGIEAANLSWDIVKVPSTFPKENRPIYVRPVAMMTHATKEDAWPDMANGILKVLAKHPHERVLIHTVSYSLARWLYDKIRIVVKDRPLFVYGNAGERDATLEGFKKARGSVMFAPSMDRGVDLPTCDVVVVAKMPFLSLGSKQVSARLYGTGAAGKSWYAAQTARTLVQSCGRHVRSETDKGIVYILDQKFIEFWKVSKNILPDWWREAVQMTGDPL